MNIDTDVDGLSPRLAAIVNALPLRPGMRVLEIGCGSGAAARAVVRRVEGGIVLAIDRDGCSSTVAIRYGRFDWSAKGRGCEAIAVFAYASHHDPRASTSRNHAASLSPATSPISRSSAGVVDIGSAMYR